MTIDDSDELNEETSNATGEEPDVVVPMDAGLFDVFNDDGDEANDGDLGDMTIDYDALLFDGDSMEDLLDAAEIKSSQSAAEDEKPDDVASVKPKKKRQSLKIEHADRSLPPPRWHSEAADKLHRKAIQMEIAKLLQMRKTSPPSEAWLQQLPHKVQKLEERLYRSAPSLEAYLDRKSLKSRLKTIAKAITQRYQEGKAKRHSIISSRSSISSLTFAENVSKRNSTASLASSESLQTIQRLAENNVLPMPVGSAFESSLHSSSRLSFMQQQQPSGSAVGDVLASQPSSNNAPSALKRQASIGGNIQQQGAENVLQSSGFPLGLSFSRPLQLPSLHAHGAMNQPTNSFVNSTNTLQGPSFSSNSTTILNQVGLSSNAMLFGQSLNLMMMNSSNNASMNSALNALQLQQLQHMQQNQMQYAVNTQPPNMLQQQGNSAFDLSQQPNSSATPYFMPNTVANANATMPPPPRQYQGISAPPSDGSPDSSKARSRKRSSIRTKKS